MQKRINVVIFIFVFGLFTSSAFAQLRVKSDGGTLLMIITDSGNLGLGVGSPSQKLDVNGGVRIRALADASENNVLFSDSEGVIGTRALSNSITANNDNVQLVNDLGQPGAKKYYGTNSTGAKGWHSLPIQNFGFSKVVCGYYNNDGNGLSVDDNGNRDYNGIYYGNGISFTHGPLVLLSPVTATNELHDVYITGVAHDYFNIKVKWGEGENSGLKFHGIYWCAFGH